MGITRRQFIKRTGLAAAGSMLGPGLLSNPFIRKALADTIGDRYFVIVFLDGGNDGLNTVAPVSNGSGTLRTAYEAARGPQYGRSLRLSAGDLAGTLIGTDSNTGAQLALHPGLIGLKQLYNAGKLAVIQGCGYPDYNLSHEQSRVIWQTANPLGLGIPNGWLGRYLAANYGSTDIPGVNINGSIAGEFAQSATGVLALYRLENFGFPYDYDYSDDTAAKRDTFLDLCNHATASDQSAAGYVGNSAIATLVSSESYPPLHSVYQSDRPAFDAAYAALENGFAEDLREVAKIIYGVKSGAPNVNARLFEVSNGGYDTHSDQGAASGQHYDLHRTVGDALKVFYDDCADMGVADKVCVIVWSEFSRRISQNENGTDHGSQGPMFVIGGSVNGGVYGNHPNLDEALAEVEDQDGNTKYSQDPGNSSRSTDLRDVFGTVLKHWLNMPAGQIVPGVLPVDGGDPDLYWTSPNLDLPFLP